MTSAQSFRAMLVNWPAAVPPRGIVVTTQGETSPFKGFMLSEQMVLFERSNPDTLGARFIAMPFDYIASIKFIDPHKANVFEGMGFAGKLSQ